MGNHGQTCSPVRIGLGPHILTIGWIDNKALPPLKILDKTLPLPWLQTGVHQRVAIKTVEVHQGDGFVLLKYTGHDLDRIQDNLHLLALFLLFERDQALPQKVIHHFIGLQVVEVQHIVSVFLDKG